MNTATATEREFKESESEIKKPNVTPRRYPAGKFVLFHINQEA
jgi:hypothetical protein